MRFLHWLFRLHRYRHKGVALVLATGRVMPSRLAVCDCGDVKPLGTVEVWR